MERITKDMILSFFIGAITACIIGFLINTNEDQSSKDKSNKVKSGQIYLFNSHPNHDSDKIDPFKCDTIKIIRVSKGFVQFQTTLNKLDDYFDSLIFGDSYLKKLSSIEIEQFKNSSILLK
jgi:hypothetical protein